MVQNPVAGRKGLVGNDFRHDGRQGGIQLIGLFPAKQLRKVPLGICVNKEDFFTLPRKTNGETCCRGGFPDTALLICQCDSVHSGTSVSFSGLSLKRGGPLLFFSR